MSLPQDLRDKIAAEIEAKFDFLFKQLSAVNNRALVDKYVTLKRVIVRKRQDAGAVVHDGEGTAVNQQLIQHPELVNTDPYGAGWLFQVKLVHPAELDALLAPADYSREIGA